MTTGFIVGKFAPLTTGHVHFINEATKRCDTLLLLLSYDSKWVAQQPAHLRDILTKENRLRWLSESFRGMDNVIVDVVDESDIKPPPYGWKEFTELVNEKVREHLDADHCTFTFTSEPSYDENMNTYFPKTQHVLIDPERSQIPISATMVRNSPNQYWEYLPAPVREDFQTLRSSF